MTEPMRFTVLSSVPVESQFNDNDSCEMEAIVVSETTEFDRRVRLLLGVTDENAPVTSTTEHTERGWDSTFESYDCVTLSCAGESMTREGSDALPRILRRLEFAEAENPRHTVMRYLKRAEPHADGDAVIHLEDGRSVTGHITGLGGWQVYIGADHRGISLYDITHITGAP